MPEVASALADVLLALAVVLVAGTAFRGWWAERHADTTDDPAARKTAQEDAKIFYGLAGLQGPFILGMALGGGVLKLFALAWLGGRALLGWMSVA